MRRLQILWTVSKSPLPANDGSRMATASLVRSLTKLGHQIDLLLMVAQEEDILEGALQEELGVRNVYVVRTGQADGKHSKVSRALKLAWAFLSAPLLPVTMARFSAGHISRGMRRILRNKWDALVYEGPHVAAHASRFGVYRREYGAEAVFYRAQNSESVLWRRRAGQSAWFLERTFLKYQAWRMEVFERSLVRRCDGLMTVSEEDLAVLLRRSAAANATTVPVGYNFPAAGERRGVAVRREILFVGKLDWYPNRDGLRWFLEKVWPVVSANKPDLKLTIAGSGDGSWISNYLPDASIEFLGYVESLDALYRRAAVCIVPVFYGSGTRIKVIEAGRFACPCISTALGVEGVGLIPGSSYILAENAEDWIRELCGVSGSGETEKVGEAAYAAVKQRFDADIIARECERFLIGVCGDGGSSVCTEGAELRFGAI